MIHKKHFSLLVVTGLVMSLALASSVFAETNDGPLNQDNGGFGGRGGRMMQNRMPPAVVGTVTAINGTTITVTSKVGPREDNNQEDGPVSPVNTPVVYTVDASNATVTKDGASSLLTNIAIGDTVAIQGTVTGTSVVAKTIRDGVKVGDVMGKKKGKIKNENKDNQDASNTDMILAGNGQPIVAGAVTAISGSSITITNKSNVTYTIDATNAKIQKGKVAGTIASIVVGDNVVVQGAINGNAVTASTIIDQANLNTVKKESKGFFGSIGSFFGKMFGF